MKQLRNVPRGPKQLTVLLFPAIASYHKLTLRAASGRMVKGSSDGINKVTHSEKWVTESVCQRMETWSLSFLGGGPPVEIEAYYAKDGSYVGDKKTASYLIERGIAPQRAGAHLNVASIGFCECEQKWFGWSHRAMTGFGIGDKYHAPGTCIPDPAAPADPDRVIKTLDEAKESAINFADDVS